MASDVFVSYSSVDRVLADAIVHGLETAGIGCWIAPRDILPGANYGEAIVAAIQDVEVMVVIVSDDANRSGHVPREVERAAAHNVSLVPLRIADIEPSPSLLLLRRGRSADQLCLAAHLASVHDTDLPRVRRLHTMIGYSVGIRTREPVHSSRT